MGDGGLESFSCMESEGSFFIATSMIAFELSGTELRALDS